MTRLLKFLKIAPILMLAMSCQPPEKIVEDIHGNQIVETIEVPRSFQLKFNSRTSVAVFNLKISHEDTKIGRINSKETSVGLKFTFLDDQNRLYGSSVSQILPIGSTGHVFDGAGHPVGSYNELVYTSLLSDWSAYEIINSVGNVIGVSARAQFGSKNLNIFDSAGGTLIARLSRPMITIFDDSWTLNVFDSTKIDLRILLSMVAHKSYVDTKRSQQ